MSSSLIPERPLLISPTLAATIGLEEAVMLHVISEVLLRYPSLHRRQRRWAEVPQAALADAMPFWDEQDIRRVRRNLQEKGLLLVEPGGGQDNLLLAINQKEEEAPRAMARPSPAAASPAPVSPAAAAFPERIFQAPANRGGSAGPIPPDWEPDEALYRQCAEHHNIPRDFIRQRVRSFVMYQRERGRNQYSWHHAFLKYIIREWRQEQSYRGARELESEMSANWRPGGEAVTILEHAGIPSDFIEDAVAEFVLYWRERGLVTSTWNTRFISHVRRQWEKFNAALEHDSTPRPIQPDYQPSAACYEVLEMANIDLDFARAKVKEFVLYWRDRGEACASWNTRFLQHVKYLWANRDRDGGLPAAGQLDSAIARMTDRSWAD